VVSPQGHYFWIGGLVYDRATVHSRVDEEVG